MYEQSGLYNHNDQAPASTIKDQTPYQASLSYTSTGSDTQKINDATDMSFSDIHPLPKMPALTLMKTVLSQHVDDRGIEEEEEEDIIFPEINTCTSFTWRHRWGRCVKDNKILYVGISVAVTCLVVNWVLMEVMLSRLHEQIRQDHILRESASSRWKHPKVNALLSLYEFRFDVLNFPIIVSETEPRVYRLDIEKVNVTWYSKSSVSYQEQISLYDTSLSSDAEDISLLYADIIRNGSMESVMNVFTGESDVNLAYQTSSWNYSRVNWLRTSAEQETIAETDILEVRKLPFWNSEDANEILGTDGSIFKPFLDETTKLTIFYPQLHRKFNLEYSELTTFKNLPVYRFIIPDSEFYNTMRTSGMSQDLSQKLGNGYCMPHCLPQGLYALSSPRRGAPKYISLPHFLGADPYYSQHIRGLQPDESRHRPFFDVDKVTGITVRQKRRFQVNVHSSFMNYSEVYLPVYWFEQSVEVTEDILKYIEVTNNSFKLLYGVCITVGVILCLSLVALVSRLVFKIVKKRTGSSRYVPLTFLRGGQCCGMVCGGSTSSVVTGSS